MSDFSTKPLPQLAAIVAFNQDFVIGKDGDLPWRLSEDLKRFKALTLGHTVIMGRKTWDSLPSAPLPGRRNIVISHNPDFIPEGAEMANSIEQAIAMCDPNGEAFIIGGASIYHQSIPFCSRILATLVNIHVEDADTFFPPLESSQWELSDASQMLTSRNGLEYQFLTYTLCSQ